MIARQVSLGLTWCLILSLVSVWSWPLYDMSVCPLLTSATAVFRISCWFLIVHLVRMFIYSSWIPLKEEVGQLCPSTWFTPPKPGLQSRDLCGAVCALSIAIVYLISFIMFFDLIHDYTVCFTGSPCCKYSYYNYISI